MVVINFNIYTRELANPNLNTGFLHCSPPSLSHPSAGLCVAGASLSHPEAQTSESSVSAPQGVAVFFSSLPILEFFFSFLSVGLRNQFNSRGMPRIHWEWLWLLMPVGGSVTDKIQTNKKRHGRTYRTHLNPELVCGKPASDSVTLHCLLSLCQSYRQERDLGGHWINLSCLMGSRSLS